MSLQKCASYTPSKERGYTLYLCDCCPYGYHIDLDFVRYCESISDETNDRSTGSIKRRKDRRRQRQSMEVLLGIAPAQVTTNSVDHTCKIEGQPKPPMKGDILSINHDGFNNAVFDFERTLERSKPKVLNNLPDVTAVSDYSNRAPLVASMASAATGARMMAQQRPAAGGASPREVEFSPLAFRNIREQMALSLERTRQLEDQIKLLPELKSQISNLKEENKRLLYKLRKSEENGNFMNANYLNSQSRYSLRNRSHSFSYEDRTDDNTSEKFAGGPPRKDCGINCTVITRNIGVGNQAPATRTVATLTSSAAGSLGNADKWLFEKLKFISDSASAGVPAVPSPASPRFIVNRSTQTAPSTAKLFSSSTQTVHRPETKIEKIDCGVQTHVTRTKCEHKGVTARPTVSDFTVQKSAELYNIGVSDDTINDVMCEKCSAIKVNVAVGSDGDLLLPPISLASLSVPRSKSFNLGEDKLNLQIKKRSVACQHEPSSSTKSSQYEPTGVSKWSQWENKSQSRSTQHEYKLADKNTQSEYFGVSRKTDTKDLPYLKGRKNVECQTDGTRARAVHVGSNTESEIVCDRCGGKDKEKDEIKKGRYSPTSPGPAPSRIPRPQPTTPLLEQRKFKRQDTYTKISSSPPDSFVPDFSSPRLSGLDISTKSVPSLSNTFDRADDSFNLPEVSSSVVLAQNGASSPTFKSQFSAPSSMSAFAISSQKQHKKAIPSKEMQGAMKVLNDSFGKSQSQTSKNQNAIDIIQQEWFKVSSLVSADPLDVEDYLDAFEDISSTLLNHIVNMADASGNTAMHYAVSHGNFDVVSILLDSKVCDINKPNKAGYTSVMLVSLAEIRSETHANVVKRLFQMADVNIRARQHGQTALMLAVSHGRLDMVKMLLEAGADINIQDDDGSSALMCAAEHGHIEIVKHFLSQPDCDSSLTDVDGSTALKIAMEAGHRPIGVLLYAHERNFCLPPGVKHKKSKSSSPKPPSSPLSIRSSHRALHEKSTN